MGTTVYKKYSVKMRDIEAAIYDGKNGEAIAEWLTQAEVKEENGEKSLTLENAKGVKTAVPDGHYVVNGLDGPYACPAETFAKRWDV